MRELINEGLRLGEAMVRLPWKAARRMGGRSATIAKVTDLGERLGTLPFRAARTLVGGGPGAQGVARSRIVVLGAGYGGLTCFLELQDHLAREHDLVLVNTDQYHWFTTELHTYVAGEPEDAVRIPLSRVIASPGRLVVGRVERIALGQRLVELAGGVRVGYDLLVCALGSDPEYYGLPGVAENSLIVGTWQGATQLRARVTALVEGRRDVPPHVVVAGGGLTGVEVAGELADEYGGRLRLTIVEAGPEIMAGFDPNLVRVSRHVLETKMVAIKTGEAIGQVEPGLIHFKNGENMDCDLLVWAGGVRGSALVAQSGLAVTPKGRAKVDAFLRAEGHPEVYLVGDAAAFQDPATGREVPPTAQFAVQMGRAVGRNILRRLRGAAEEPFVPHLLGSFASLGRTAGVGQIGQEHFTGLPAMVVKNLIEAHHAWETGGGVMPLVNRLLRGPQRYIRGRVGERVPPTPRPNAGPL